MLESTPNYFPTSLQSTLTFVPNPTKKPPTINPMLCIDHQARREKNIMYINMKRRSIPLKTHGETRGTPEEYPCIFSSFNASGSISTRVVRQNAARKASFQCWDGSVKVFLGATTNEDINPDAPRMSPLNRRRVAADNPMSDPPIRPVTGVKKLIDMLIWFFVPLLPLPRLIHYHTHTAPRTTALFGSRFGLSFLKAGWCHTVKNQGYWVSTNHIFSTTMKKDPRVIVPPLRIHFSLY